MQTMRVVVVLYIFHLPDVDFLVLPRPSQEELVVVCDCHCVDSWVVLVQSGD